MTYGSVFKQYNYAGSVIREDVTIEYIFKNQINTG